MSEFDSQSMIVGSIPTKVKLATKSEESRQLSVIPGKRQKESRGVVTSRGRTGVTMLRLALGYSVVPCAKHRNPYLAKIASVCAYLSIYLSIYLTIYLSLEHLGSKLEITSSEQS